MGELSIDRELLEEVAERLDRNWLCVELMEEYLEGALGRFERNGTGNAIGVGGSVVSEEDGIYYRVPHPGILWNEVHGAPLPADGGEKRQMNGMRKSAVSKDEKKKPREGRDGRRTAVNS